MHVQEGYCCCPVMVDHHEFYRAVHDLGLSDSTRLDEHAWETYCGMRGALLERMLATALYTSSPSQSEGQLASLVRLATCALLSIAYTADAAGDRQHETRRLIKRVWKAVDCVNTSAGQGGKQAAKLIAGRNNFGYCESIGDRSVTAYMGDAAAYDDSRLVVHDPFEYAEADIPVHLTSYTLTRYLADQATQVVAR